MDEESEPPCFGTNESSLNDVINNIQKLHDFSIIDDQPNIEGFSQTLEYRVNFDTNFEDRNAYVTGCSKYIEEATRHGEFNKMLEKGFIHAGQIYTWRCLSRAIPMIKSNDQPNRLEINETIAKVFQPEINKLLELMYFTNDAIAMFSNEIKRLSHPEKRKDFVSEAYLLTLGEFLNMLAVLDELKNMKASIKNDFSTYRRAVQSNLNLVLADMQELNTLSLFLATQNNIKEKLRLEIQKFDNYEDILADVINICAHFYENLFYLSPNEKHMFVKVIALSLYLIDNGKNVNASKMDQKKKINIAKLDIIFKSMDVVPLYGDMQISPFSFVRKSPGFETAKWPLSSSNLEDKQQKHHCHVNIIEKVKMIRNQHDKYVGYFARIRNDYFYHNNHHQQQKEERPTKPPKTTNTNANEKHKYQEIFKLSLIGLKLLCSWTCDVVETISWKLFHPTNHELNPECPENAENYARATRYNYSSKEKAALIEIIAMIKGVQALIGKMEPEFSIAIRSNIYNELQTFVQQTLFEPLFKATKNKKDFIAGILTSIIVTCIHDNDDTSLESRGSDMNSLKKRKKKMDTLASSSIAAESLICKPISPSTTQLYMARTMLESLISERGGKKNYRKDLDSKYLDKMEIFLRDSFHWNALLNLSKSIEKSSDLSQLWFREFYLEMTMGSRIQFPIEMSMPWILMDYILSTQNSAALIECILYQLDLYNDAAMFSLKIFKKKFLFDECEAEVNLVFDQFIFKLSDAIFTYYKQMASTMLLDKGFKKECEKIGINIQIPSATRFEILLRQRHFQLLGRQINLNKLITQRLNNAFLKSLDAAISGFEAEGLSWIITLDQLIEVNRLSHRLLSKELPSLANFDQLLGEANHQVSEINGRITLHACHEIFEDLIPNFCFNLTTRRFVRNVHLIQKFHQRQKPPPVNYSYEFGSRSLNIAFSNLCTMYSRFIGSPHLQALTRLIGYQGLATMIDGLLDDLEILINERLKPHIEELFKLVPKICKLPRFDYGSEAVLQYFLHHLKDIIAYPELKKELCQILREIGNILFFLMQLEMGLNKEEICDLLAAASFTNVIPKPSAEDPQELNDKMLLLERKFSRIHISAVIKNVGTHNQAKLAEESNLLTTERICVALSMFEKVLFVVRNIFDSDTIWKGTIPPTNGVMWIDECMEFHRIWSAIQLSLCLPSEDGFPSIEEVFGDGIHFAGCCIINLLGQWNRFEVFDFSSHLLRVHEFQTISSTTTAAKGNESHVPSDSAIPLKSVIEKVHGIQLLNSQMFHLLNNFTRQIGEQKHIREYFPPIHPKYQPPSSPLPAELEDSEKSDE